MRVVLAVLAGFLGGMTLGFVATWAGLLLWEGVVGYTPAPGPDDHSALDWLLVAMGAGGLIGAAWLGMRARTRPAPVATIVFALLGLPALAYLVMVLGDFAVSP